MICWVKGQFSRKLNILFSELQLQAFLITKFVQTCSKFFVNFINSTDYVVDVFF